MNRTPPARCLVPSCPHVGYWFASHGRCPPHYAELLEQTRAAIVRHRNPDPQDPTGTAPAGLTEEGAPPR